MISISKAVWIISTIFVAMIGTQTYLAFNLKNKNTDLINTIENQKKDIERIITMRNQLVNLDSLAFNNISDNISNYLNKFENDIRSEKEEYYLDEEAGLYWELKTLDFSPRDVRNRFTYDLWNSHRCNFVDVCLVEDYVNYANETKIGRFNDWRVPTFSELKSIRPRNISRSELENRFENLRALKEDEMTYWTSTKSRNYFNSVMYKCVNFGDTQFSINEEFSDYSHVKLRLVRP